MNWNLPRPMLRARLMSGVIVAAALNLAPALAQSTHAAVIATFQPAVGALIVEGDSLDNTITISRDAAGAILINGGAVNVRGQKPTVANTTEIRVFGLDGNDQLVISEVNGALPKAFLFGGAGNDTLIGGSAADQLFGESGDDTLLGKGGIDLLFGGADNDTLTGGEGDDQVFGESGNDRLVWNPGDDTDLNEGGDGIDTVEVNGGNGAEVFSATANATRVRFDRITPAPFSLDIGTSENLVLNANGGDDSFSATGNLAALIQITVDGGAGNDTLNGGDGADVLLGGDGNDVIDGNRGNDLVLLGAGDDTTQWDPGDGSDVIEGQAGIDKLIFHGANVTEKIDLSANGQRVRLSRDIAAIVMDIDDVETLDLSALGGADTITVGDLSGTDVAELDLGLDSPPGSGAGDAQPDRLILTGTNGDDSVEVLGAGSSYGVVGLHAFVKVAGSEGALDTLAINLLGGADNLSATTLPADVVQLTVDGGTGNDRLFGSAGRDNLFGGDGDDIIDGQRGDDFIILGAGDDVVQWDPGDGSDTVEGQAGKDRMLFNGSNISENIDVSANGGRVRFFRNIAAVTMDLNDLEVMAFNAVGGADAIVVNDLTGTDATEVQLDLRATPGTGAGDGQADSIVLNGTNGDDVITVSGSAAGVTVSGLKAVLNIVGNEAANDQLTVNGLGGADVVDASGLQAGAIKLSLSGGSGDDLFLGSQGNDLIVGNQGNDVVLMGAGDDQFTWNPGDGNDVVEGQAGSDALIFNGANISEKFDVSANGGRVRLTRDVAVIVMDINDLERTTFNALGGADVVTVNDLSGTDLSELNVNLASTLGGGDGAIDTLIVNGTNGADAVSVAGSASGVAVLGLSARVNVTGSEVANDGLRINLLAGDDVGEASGLAAGAIKLTLDGGAGDDVLIGSAGNDVLDGGTGDDVLLGGPGTDIGLNGELMIEIP